MDGILILIKDERWNKAFTQIIIYSAISKEATHSQKKQLNSFENAFYCANSNKLKKTQWYASLNSIVLPTIYCNNNLFCSYWFLFSIYYTKKTKNIYMNYMCLMHNIQNLFRQLEKRKKPMKYFYLLVLRLYCATTHGSMDF